MAEYGPGICFTPPRSAGNHTEDTHLEGGRCVDPITLFMTPQELSDAGESALSSSRCNTVCMNGGSKVEDTRETEICIRPRKDSELLRIRIRLPTWAVQAREPVLKTVIWNGPREEVWEQGEKHSDW